MACSRRSQLKIFAIGGALRLRTGWAIKFHFIFQFAASYLPCSSEEPGLKRFPPMDPVIFEITHSFDSFGSVME